MEMNSEETLILFEIAHYALDNSFDEVGDYLDLNDEDLKKLQDKLAQWLES